MTIFLDFFRKLRWMLLLVLATLVFFIGTETGLDTLLYTAKQFIPGTLSYQAVHGCLWEHVVIDNLAYQYPAKKINITLKKLDLSWTPMAYFEQKPIIQALILEKMQILFDAYTVKADTTILDKKMHAVFTIDGKKTLLGEFTIKGQYQPVVNADWTLNIPNAAHLSPELNGKITGHGKLHGQPNNITLTALFTINIPLPDLGLVLDTLSFEAKRTEKTLDIKGFLGKNHAKNTQLNFIVASKAPFNAFQAKLTGTDFTLMNTEEYVVRASPNLAIEYTDNTLHITGDVNIPYARIEPMEFAQTVELPADVVFVSDQQKEEKPPITLDSRIHITLGDDVMVKTHGLDGKLAGAVTVIDVNNEPTLGEGKITMTDGSYVAYGQKLDIQEAQATFSDGPIDNPQLLIRATRTFKTTSQLSPITNTAIPTGSTDITTLQPPSQFNSMIVGIEITGYAKNPTIRLFSNPATLSQADILSFLVLGRPMSQASSADGALLLQAVSAMNVQGANPTQITQQLQNTLGLDVLSVESTSQYDPSQNMVTNSTALVIGKALSPRLYIDYSVGIMQDINILKLKYLLKPPHWILQTETDGNNQGVDILYSFSRD